MPLQKPLIYVVHFVTGKVERCFGARQNSVDQAIRYVTRRTALTQYLAMRDGFVPNVSIPLEVMARTGRPIPVGVPIAKVRTGRFRGRGGRLYTKRGRPDDSAVVVSVLNAEFRRELSRIKSAYPWVWQRYMRYTL